MKEIYYAQSRQLGLKIACFRKLRGLMQEQLAGRIDRAPVFIGHMEAPNINKAVSLDTLFNIAQLRGCWMFQPTSIFIFCLTSRFAAGFSCGADADDKDFCRME